MDNSNVIKHLQREFPGKKINLKKIKFEYEDEQGRLIPVRGLEVYIDNKSTGEILTEGEHSSEYIIQLSDFIREQNYG